MKDESEDDIYEADTVSVLLEDDELTPEEEAFMIGYDMDIE